MAAGSSQPVHSNDQAIPTLRQAVNSGRTISAFSSDIAHGLSRRGAAFQAKQLLLVPKAAPRSRRLPA
jgi:hypothetical protein